MLRKYDDENLIFCHKKITKMFYALFRMNETIYSLECKLLCLHGIWLSVMAPATNRTASLVLVPQLFALLPVPPFERMEAGGGFDSSGI